MSKTKKIKSKTNKTKKTAKRMKYGTEVNFPPKFTLSQLYAANEHKIKRITLYTRIQKGIEAGTIAEDGLHQPEEARRGRREQIYSLVTAGAQPEVVADTAAPNSDW